MHAICKQSQSKITSEVTRDSREWNKCAQYTMFTWKIFVPFTRVLNYSHLQFFIHDCRVRSKANTSWTQLEEQLTYIIKKPISRNMVALHIYKHWTHVNLREKGVMRHICSIFYVLCIHIKAWLYFGHLRTNVMLFMLQGFSIKYNAI